MGLGIRAGGSRFSLSAGPSEPLIFWAGAVDYVRPRTVKPSGSARLMSGSRRLGAMARYFFHLEDGSGVLRDDMGEEFGNIEQVETFAAQVARELARNRPDRVAQSLLVTDA